jgi:hypothetical protein
MLRIKHSILSVPERLGHSRSRKSALLSDIIGQLRDWIFGALESAGQFVWDTFISPVINALHSAWDWLANVVQSGFNLIREPISWIWNALTSLGQTIWNALSSAFQPVWNAITGLGNWIISGLTQAASYVGSFFSQIGQMILSGLLQIPNAVGGFLQWIGSSLTSLGQQIWTGLSQIGQTIQNAVWNGLQQLGQWLWSTVVTRFQEFASAAWNTLSWIGSQIQAGLHWVWDQLTAAVSNLVSSFISGIQSCVEALKQGNIYVLIPLVLTSAGSGFAIALGLTAANTKVAGTGTDTKPISDFLHDLFKPGRILDMTMGAAIAVGIERPLHHHFNRLFRTNLPSVADAQRMMWRGKITEDQFVEVLQSEGYPDEYIEGYRELAKQLPGAGDLVRFVVRECFPLEALPEAPEEFVKYMKMQGFSEEWSKAYWFAHWELPGFGELREAFWRGIINEDEFRQFIVWRDYAPFARKGISKSDVDILKELSYKLPGRLEARWMLKWGIISKDELINLTKMEGYHPDWADKVAESEFMNLLSDERSFLITQLKSSFILGTITEEVMRQVLADNHLTQPEIDLIIKGCTYKQQVDMIQIETDTAVTEFRFGYITIEELSARLSSLGLSNDRVQAILNREKARIKKQQERTPEEEVKAFGYATVVTRYVEGLIDDATFETELRSLGYNDAQIARYKVYAQLKKDYEFAKDLLSAVSAAYRRNKIGDMKLIDLCRKYGIPDDTIMRVLSLEKLRKGLGVEEAS